MSEWEKDGYRKKNTKFRENKKNIKQQRKISMKNKNSFIYDNESSNINDVPLSIYNNNKIFKNGIELSSNDIINKDKSLDDNIIDNDKSLNDDNNKSLNDDNNKSLNDDNNKSLNDILNDSIYDSDEYEEYTPDYFEPIPYVKK